MPGPVRRRAVGIALAALAALTTALVAVMLGGDAPGRGDRIGLSTHLTSGSDAIGPELAAIGDAGIGWIREDFTWARIEPERGTRDWQRTDELMRAAAAAGVDVLAILDYSAPWATSDSGGDLEAPPR